MYKKENIMNFFDINGDLFLNDEAGLPVRVANVKRGVSYNKDKGVHKARQVTSVTVFPLGSNNLSDVFLFYSDELVPFHSLQSRDIVPGLLKVYVEFFVNGKHYGIEDFLSSVVTDYFVGQHNYTLRTDLMPQTYK
ncbi:MAG TPA: hypothetical protein VNZ49_11920 [Bacteroidia bacterium]|jgi:hypothetical protein|nr:hypothetical protein [Bacteroidia bacterium]